MSIGNNTSSNPSKTTTTTSSSLSSLSSTSSNVSVSQTKESNLPSPQSQKITTNGLQQLKNTLLLNNQSNRMPIPTTNPANSNLIKKYPSKVVPVSSSASKNIPTNSSLSPKTRTNQPKQSQNLTNNQHKPRLFAPYTLNINTSTNTNDINNSNPKPSLTLNPSTKLPTPATTATLRTNFDSASTKIPVNPAPTINPQFKLYSQLNGFKLSSNFNKPQKSNSTDENSLETSNKESPVTTPSTQTSATNSEIENYTQIEMLNQNFSSTDLKNTIKREDSAYCSSTSSTVSSQDVEINRYNSKSNCELCSGTSSTNEITTDCMANKTDGNEAHLNSKNDDLDDNNLSDNIESDMRLNENDDSIKSNSISSKIVPSIKESFDELNQLKQQQHLLNSQSTDVLDDLSLDNSSIKNCANLRQRRTSLNSVNSNLSTSTNSPMFKPPSKLPPCENSEIIQIDIETFRLVMQDIQNTKTILYKLAHLLREPTSNAFSNNGNNDNLLDFQPDDFQNLINNNPLVSSFYSHNFNNSNSVYVERVERATQTDNSNIW